SCDCSGGSRGTSGALPLSRLVAIGTRRTRCRLLPAEYQPLEAVRAGLQANGPDRPGPGPRVPRVPPAVGAGRRVWTLSVPISGVDAQGAGGRGLFSFWHCSSPLAE